jgi:CelD/BcsL family acetyltransferase involved in cellulose biosynthesis
VLLEPAAQFQISIAHSLDDLAALAPAWHKLWLCDPRATPFQSPAWLIPWAKHFTAGDLRCVTVHDGDRLVALIPTFVWRNPEMKQRELLLLGTGISDYCDALCVPEYPHVIDAALEQLDATCDWDWIHFHELRADSPLLRGCFEEQSTIPILKLPATTDELRAVIPKAQLQNLAYYRRRAERVGDSEWQIADGQSLDAMMDQLFALHQSRWRSRGEPGVFDEENVRAFHREAARGLLRIGALRLRRLTINDETVAVLYAFASHGRTYYYASGFNPEFAHISPGTLIIGHAIEQAIREGCTHFDFLRGAERYKNLWGARDMQTFRVRCVRKNFCVSREGEPNAG